MTTWRSTPPPSAAPGTPGVLALLTDLFGRLHAEQIRYCHWKSNEHLGTSLQGTTDLDVLVLRKDARRLARLLTEVDFKPFRKLTGLDYPGIEDYLGFDADTGRLSHLHVHYQLTLGEKFLKGYRLPWEDLALATRRWDAEQGLYAIDSGLEALLLVTRAALKLRARDYVRAAAGYAYLGEGALRELSWLARRADGDHMRSVARALVGDRAAELLRDIVAAPAPSIRQLVAFRRSVRPHLDTYRMYGAWDALRRRWMREWGWGWAAVTNRARGLKQRSTRTAPQGGLTVCVSGPQTVATTVACQLVSWLAPEIAVVPALGEGARSSLARRARARGMVVVADRPPTGPADHPPDLILELSDSAAHRFGRASDAHTVYLDGEAPPASLLLQAQRAVWECI